MDDERLPSKERLRKDKEFAHIFKLGERRYGRNITIIRMETNDRKIGIIISRHIKGSVGRNKLKRRLRAIYRRNKDYFNGNNIIIAYPGAERMSYYELNDELIKLTLPHTLKTTSSPSNWAGEI